MRRQRQGGRVAFIVRAGVPADLDLIRRFIPARAEYERPSHAVGADPATLAQHLLWPRPMAEG